MCTVWGVKMWSFVRMMGEIFPKLWEGLIECYWMLLVAEEGSLAKILSIKINKVQFFFSKSKYFVEHLHAPTRRAIRVRFHGLITLTKATDPMRHRWCQPRIQDWRIHCLFDLFCYSGWKRCCRRLCPSEKTKCQARRHRALIRKRKVYKVSR